MLCPSQGCPMQTRKILENWIYNYPTVRKSSGDSQVGSWILSLEFLGGIFSGTYVGTISLQMILKALRLDGLTIEVTVIRDKERPKDMPWVLHHGEGGEDEDPTTETESWNSNHKMALPRLQRLLKFQRTRTQVSPPLRTESFPMNIFLSQNGIKWRSNYLTTHVANECRTWIKIEHRCSQTQFKTMEAWCWDAECSSGGRSLVGPRWLLGVHTAAVMAGTKQTPNAVSTFCLFQ